MQQPIPPGEKGASQALKPQHSVRFVAPAPSVRGEVPRIPVKEDDEDPDVDVSALVQEFNQSHVDATGLQSTVRGSHGPAPEPQRAPAAMPFMWSRVVTKGTSAPPPASLKSYPTATSTPAGTIGPIAPVTLSGSGDAEAGSAPPATVDTPEDTEANKEETKKLIKWVEYFIRQHGGRVIGANLGSALASSNGAMYRTIKSKYGGLTPLLSKFPDHFVLESDPPFNHVSLTDSHFAAAYKLMVLEAGLSKQSGQSAAAQKSPEELEADFVRHTAAILMDAPATTLKAVELANVLRARMGTDALAMVREVHGGLLALLEKHRDVFRVDRVPKNDCVCLVADAATLSALRVEDARKDGGQAGGGVKMDASGALPESWSSSLAIPSRCLHVGNVAVSMTEDKLRQQFAAFGKIESMKLVSQKGRRFAFVNYTAVSEAEAAKNALSKVHMWRSNISFAKRETIAMAMGLPGVGKDGDMPTSYGRLRNLTPSRHLWVGSLTNTSRAKLMEIFTEFGEVEDIHFLKDRRCAFVDFKSEEDCVMAYRMMHRRKIGDSVIELGFGRPKEAEDIDFDRIWDSPDTGTAQPSSKPLPVPVTAIASRGPAAGLPPAVTRTAAFPAVPSRNVGSAAVQPPPLPFQSVGESRLGFDAKYSAESLHYRTPHSFGDGLSASTTIVTSQPLPASEDDALPSHIGPVDSRLAPLEPSAYTPYPMMELRSLLSADPPSGTEPATLFSRDSSLVPPAPYHPPIGPGYSTKPDQLFDRGSLQFQADGFEHREHRPKDAYPYGGHRDTGGRGSSSYYDGQQYFGYPSRRDGPSSLFPSDIHSDRSYPEHRGSQMGGYGGDYPLFSGPSTTSWHSGRDHESSGEPSYRASTWQPPSVGYGYPAYPPVPPGYPSRGYSGGYSRGPAPYRFGGAATEPRSLAQPPPGLSARHPDAEAPPPTRLEFGALPDYSTHAASLGRPALDVLYPITHALTTTLTKWPGYPQSDPILRDAILMSLRRYGGSAPIGHLCAELGAQFQLRRHADADSVQAFLTAFPFATTSLDGTVSLTASSV